MNADKILDVIKTYRRHFIEEGIDPHDSPHDSKPVSCDEILSHCHGMLGKMEKFVSEGRIEKTFRWLGFIQGCLWSTDQFTLNDLKDHNRPDAEKFWWGKRICQRLGKIYLKRKHSPCIPVI